MSEPTLNDISDYDTLTGQKKRIVWAVIIAGLLIGAIYYVAAKTYTDKGDALNVSDTIKVVPETKCVSL